MTEIDFNPDKIITVADLPSGATLDTELDQYVKKLRSFESANLAPIELVADTWQPLGIAYHVGELGRGTLWDVLVYFQYTHPTGGINQPYFQYCGGGTIAAIYWQADMFITEGILAPTEAHNDPDFAIRLRFGRGNQFRKVEVKPDRAISIASGGVCRVNGVQKI